jgi:hypothetical protein
MLALSNDVLSVVECESLFLFELFSLLETLFLTPVLADSDF